MTGYNFTDRVRKVLQLAREEASELHHPSVDTAHILLGLLDEGEGVATAVLNNLNAHAEDLRKAVEAVMPPGKNRDLGPDLAYTSKAKKVLEYAMSEASDLGHSYVGTEHLLLGLVRTEKTISATVLATAGITAENTRAEVIRLRGTTPRASGNATESSDRLARKALIVATASLAVALLALLIAVAK